MVDQVVDAPMYADWEVENLRRHLKDKVPGGVVNKDVLVIGTQVNKYSLV